MILLLLLLVLPAVVLGAISQRVTGMGFALVVAPLLVLLLDPLAAVIIVNLCGAASAIVIGLRMRAHVDWGRFFWLAAPALIGVIPGTWLLLVLSRGVLEVVLGALLLVALTVSLLVHRTTFMLDGPAPRLIAGFSSGLMNSAAGVGGPAATTYAVLSRWHQQSFAATMQPYLLTIASASLLSKYVMAPGEWPIFDWWLWLGVVASLVVGLIVGERISPHVDARLARVIVVVIAYAGATLAVVKGATGWPR